MNRKLIYLLIVALAAFAIWKLVPSQPNKQSSENAGGPMTAVAVPQLSATATQGEALFNENCAVCHGKNAAGVMGTGPTFIHKVYVPSHHGDGAFLIAVKNGVRQHHWPFGNMPPVEGVTNDEVSKIIIYVRELQKANKIF